MLDAVQKRLALIEHLQSTAKLAIGLATELAPVILQSRSWRLSSRCAHGREAQRTRIGAMHRTSRFLLALAALASADAACAQPPSLFQARCSELRGAMSGLHGRQEDERTTIEVVGLLASVRDAGGIVYLGLCGPPDPRVLCVTYETMGRKLGDRVVVTGTILPRDPDLVHLEPCVHREPGPEDKN
jgi:hypothetical protein